MHIYETNKIFAVHFKRFLNNRKNKTIVSAPKILDLSPFIVETDRHKLKGKNTNCMRRSFIVAVYMGDITMLIATTTKLKNGWSITTAASVRLTKKK